MQLRGPSPNGMYGLLVNALFFVASGLKRSGEKRSGWGQYLGSRWRAIVGIMMAVPSSIVDVEFGMVQGSVDWRLRNGTPGYIRRVSAN